MLVNQKTDLVDFLLDLLSILRLPHHNYIVIRAIPSLPIPLLILPRQQGAQDEDDNGGGDNGAGDDYPRYSVSVGGEKGVSYGLYDVIFGVPEREEH